MNDTPDQGQPPPVGEIPHGDPDAWKVVYFGQVSQDLVPRHPEPPETPEDELTQLALGDPGDVRHEGSHPAPGPTLWRLLFLILLAIAALTLVLWGR
jgi:hypothetical protein